MLSGLKPLVWENNTCSSDSSLGVPLKLWSSSFCQSWPNICWKCSCDCFRLDYSKSSQQPSSKMLLPSHPPSSTKHFLMMFSSAFCGVNCKYCSLALRRWVKWLHLGQAANDGISDASNWKRLQGGLPLYATTFNCYVFAGFGVINFPKTPAIR